ncbi:hypothetical protein SAMD00019534_060020, partial [Acytostelium subglobosum LB1]|uniref:hypothetical protein n=1 Tax=Acytostelium subglobosum LB1 TaxID=1410327 RepID=UPI00064498A4
FQSKKDYSLRRSMTQNGNIWVAEDCQTQRVIGGICISEKRLRVNGEERVVYYPFDAVVDPRYRRGRVLKRLTDMVTEVYLDNQVLRPLLYTSTAIHNGNMSTYYNNSVMKQMVEQVQHAWKVSAPIVVMDSKSNPKVTIWKERNPDIVIEKFKEYFKSYEMVPIEMEDLLLNKFWRYTYFAQYKCDDQRVIEASISIWDQNKVSKLVDMQRDGVPMSASNFYQLFGCYTNEQGNDYPLLTELLKTIHNECHSMGIEYLFAGFSKTDPVERFFPLQPGLKSLPFLMHFCVSCEEDEAKIQEYRHRPFFNDPRDYGMLLLYSSNKKSKEDGGLLAK